MNKFTLNFGLIVLMAVSSVGCGAAIKADSSAGATDSTESDSFVGTWLNAASVEDSCIDIPLAYRPTVLDEEGNEFVVRYIRNFNVISKESDGVYLHDSVVTVFKEAACAGSEFYIKAIETTPYMQLTTNAAEQVAVEHTKMKKLTAPSLASDQLLFSFSTKEDLDVVQEWVLGITVGEHLAFQRLFDYSGPGASSYTEQQVLDSLDTYISALNTFIASPLDEAVQVWTKI